MAEYSRNDDNGASAGSSGGPEFEDVSAPRGGSDVVGRGPAPEFEEAAGPAGAGEPGNAEAGPQVGAPAAGTPGKRSRWPARIIGGVIVLAILAILLGMFLPRERSEARREQSAVNNQQFATAPQPQQTLRQQPQPQPSANAQPSVAETGACSDCGGSGVVACPMKHLPNGHLLNLEFWAEERYYKGPDPLLPDMADAGECPICKGTLKTICSSCKGTGKALANSGAEGTTPGYGGLTGEDAESVQKLMEQMGGGQ